MNYDENQKLNFPKRSFKLNHVNKHSASMCRLVPPVPKNLLLRHGKMVVVVTLESCMGSSLTLGYAYTRFGLYIPTWLNAHPPLLIITDFPVGFCVGI